MLQEKTLKYYDWDDIQTYFCQRLGIGYDEFRDYHLVVGGSYKDWWHVWLTLVCDDVSNDSYKRVWINVLAWDNAVSEYGVWVLALKPIVEDLFAGREYVHVCYSW